MAEWVGIANGELGSSVRAKLNNIGVDMDISVRVVSAISQVSSEMNYFQTDTVIYSIAEKSFYKYSGTVWEIFDFPTLFTEIAEIDNTDSPYTMGSELVVIGDTSSGDITVNLTSLSGISGREIEFKNIGSGNMTLDANGTELIDSDETMIVYQWESVRLVATSSRWVIM